MDTWIEFILQHSHSRCTVMHPNINNAIFFGLLSAFDHNSRFPFHTPVCDQERPCEVLSMSDHIMYMCNQHGMPEFVERKDKLFLVLSRGDLLCQCPIVNHVG